MYLPNILFPVFMFAFIFHCRSFSPCWLLAFLNFTTKFSLMGRSPHFLSYGAPRRAWSPANNINNNNYNTNTNNNIIIITTTTTLLILLLLLLLLL